MSTDRAECWPVDAMAPKTVAGHAALNRTVPSETASLPRPFPRPLAPPLPPRPRPPLPPLPLSTAGTMPGDPPFLGWALAFSMPGVPPFFAAALAFTKPGEPPSFGFALPVTELGVLPAFGLALPLDFAWPFSLSSLPLAFLSCPLDFFPFFFLTASILPAAMSLRPESSLPMPDVSHAASSRSLSPPSPLRCTTSWKKPQGSSLSQSGQARNNLHTCSSIASATGKHSNFLVAACFSQSHRNTRVQAWCSERISPTQFLRSNVREKVG